MIKTWKIITRNLEPVSFEVTPENLNQVTKLLPGGAYTTFRTLGKTRVICLQDHLNRLQETAHLTNHQLSIPWDMVRLALRKALEEFPAAELKGRIILDLECKPGDLYLLLEPLTIPNQQDYDLGVSVVTRQLKRDNPKAKQTNFINQADEVRKTLSKDIFEAIMVDEDGQLLEGLTSNFFALKENQLWTAGEGVLPGITRTRVIEEARALGIAIQLSGIQESELAQAEEAFLTGSSRAVLPITRINGVPVGNGKPGPVTLLLLQRYQQKLEQLAETV